MKNLKINIILAVFVLIIFILSCSVVNITDSSDDVNNTNYSASESFSYEFAIKSQNKIYIDAVNGTIDIVGINNSSTTKVWGEKIVKSDNESDAALHLKNLKTSVSETDDGIYLETTQPSDTNGREYLVNYYLSIPAECAVSAKIINGVLKIDSLNSDIAVEMTNGEIQLEEINGNLDILLTNGKVFCQMILPETGNCEITSVNAEMQLQIPKNTSANFAAGVVNGIVNVTNLDFQNLQSANNFVNGMLGNGNGIIRLEAVNGVVSASGY